MKTRIFNLIVLDESGSMGSIRQEAVNSVNETVQTIRKAQQKHEDQEHIVTFVTFNDECKTVWDCAGCNEIEELAFDKYNPDSMTALYDALGMSLTALRRKVSAEDRVLVTVVTDGMENASREYSGSAIKSMIAELKENGWVFAYIGANHDVEKAAANISITNTLRFETTSSGMKTMSRRENTTRQALYHCMAAPNFDSAEANRSLFHLTEETDED